MTASVGRALHRGRKQVASPDEHGGSAGAEAGGSEAAIPLVLLPGTLCDERVFGPLVERLSGREVQVIPTTNAGSTVALAQTILAEAPPRFILIGFSLGGIVALEVAAVAPERVLGLVIIASTARPAIPEHAEGRRAEVADARTRGIAAFLIDRLWSRYVGSAAREDRVLQCLVLDMAQSLGMDAFARQTEVALGRADSRPRLGKLPMPVLAICGEEDLICTPEFHREIAAGVADASLHIIAGVGHFVLLEAPRATADIIVAWLDCLPPACPSIRHPTAKPRN